MIGTLRTVVLDAPDARRLAAFYTALGGWTEQYADDEWVTTFTGDGWRLGFQAARDHVPPQWPDGASQQMHFDLATDDARAADSRVLDAGGRRLRPTDDIDASARPGSRVYASPAGHPFCLRPA